MKLFQQAGVNQTFGFDQGVPLTASQVNVQHIFPVGAHASTVIPLGGFARNEDDSAVVRVGIKYCVDVDDVIFLHDAPASARTICLELLIGVAYPLDACSGITPFGR